MVCGEEVLGFRVIGSFRAAASQMIAGITDICARVVDGAVHVYTTTRAGGGILALELTGNGAGLRLIDQQELPTGTWMSAPPKLSQVDLDGGPILVWTGGWGTRPGAYWLGEAGGIDRWLGLKDGPGGIQTAQAFFARQGQTFAAIAGQSSGQLQLWAVDGAGRMVLRDAVSLAGAEQAVEVAALEVMRSGARTFLVSLSNLSDGVTVWQVTASGTLKATSTIGASAGMGISTPSALALAEAGGKQWLFVAGAGSSSLSVIRVDDKGVAALTDHVIDTLETRFQSVQAIATAVVRDRVFLFAGGADEGLSAFVLLPDGRLVHAGNLLKDDSLALDNITAIEAMVVGGRIELVVAGEGSGLHRISVDPGKLAPELRGSGQGEVLEGGTANDLIAGMGGDDTLSGGAGDDILFDGGGADEMRGGAGADVFVLAADGETDIIRDFTPGEDRLDLSGWGRIYSVEVLPMKERAGCVVIRWGDEALYVYSADGRSIDPAIFSSSDFFGLWHVVAPTVVAGQRLSGAGRSETLTGGAGDDTLEGSAGGDLLIGGGGRDLVDYGGMAAAVLADLTRGGGGAAQGDRYDGIEHLAGSRFDDTLRGDDRANRLDGGDGNDLLAGAGGDDLLEGGAGADTLDGGAGADTLSGGSGRDRASYASAWQGIVVNLAVAGQNAGGAAGDVLRGIEEVEGSRHADNVTGDVSGNALYGGGGADLLDGADGNDRLEGGAGADTLVGDDGDDWLIGGKGADWAWYAGRAEVRVDLALTGWQNTGGRGRDWLEGIENLRGGWRDDRLRGDDKANRIDGDGGNDLLDGRDGADWLTGGEGDDTISGGSGFDWALYAGSVAVSVDLSIAATQETGLGRDLLSGIEALRGGSGGDRLSGDAAANRLGGMQGNDTLIGRGGNDRLRGGAGNDVLVGGPGDDRLQGGAGMDVAVYSGKRGIAVSLAQKGAQDIAGHGADRLSSIEGLRGGTGADRLTGNARDNLLEGGAGADRLIGRTGSDLLIGGNGNDTLTGGGGGDTLSGGGGFDWAIYTTRRDVTVNLSLIRPQSTAEGVDQLTGIEGVRSASGDDRLTGNSAANWLIGGGGDDLLIGGAGRDTLDGGTGDDILIGGSGADRFVFTGGDDSIRDFDGREGDRLWLDESVLTMIRGKTAVQIVARWGHDLGASVELDFGQAGSLHIQGISTLSALRDWIEVI